MEYYNGILFLTTNRPGVIDEAVQSRVHLSLRYEALNLDQMVAIFEHNITQLRSIEQKRAAARKEREMEIFDTEILDFAKDHWHRHTAEIDRRWNGRQIRNAFSTAASLAHFEAQGKPGKRVQLRAENFRKVQAAMLEYQKYRASILGGTDGEIAREKEARNDYHDVHPAADPQGPQVRGQRAAETSARYGSQGQGTPTTPIRRPEQQYGQWNQSQASSLPAEFNPAASSSQAGSYRYTSPTHPRGYGATQDNYPQPQLDMYAQSQERIYHTRREEGYSGLSPESYGQGQGQGQRSGPGQSIPRGFSNLPDRGPGAAQDLPRRDVRYSESAIDSYESARDVSPSQDRGHSPAQGSSRRDGGYPGPPSDSYARGGQETGRPVLRGSSPPLEPRHGPSQSLIYPTSPHADEGGTQGQGFPYQGRDDRRRHQSTFL